MQYRQAIPATLACLRNRPPVSPPVPLDHRCHDQHRTDDELGDGLRDAAGGRTTLPTIISCTSGNSLTKSATRREPV